MKPYFWHNYIVYASKTYGKNSETGQNTRHGMLHSSNVQIDFYPVVSTWVGRISPPTKNTLRSIKFYFLKSKTRSNWGKKKN